MRKIIAVVNVSLLALAVGICTVSAAPPAKSSAPTKSSSSAAPKAAKATAPATHTVSGTLESFDPTALSPSRF